jgi:hypothetical protein
MSQTEEGAAKSDLLHEAILNEADRRQEIIRLHALLATKLNATKTIRYWIGISLTIISGIAYWIDTKLEKYTAAVTQINVLATQNQYAVITEAAVNKAQEVWINDIKAALQPMRDDIGKHTLTIHDLANEVKNLQDRKK